MRWFGVQSSRIVYRKLVQRDISTVKSLLLLLFDESRGSASLTLTELIAGRVQTRPAFFCYLI